MNTTVDRALKWTLRILLGLAWLVAFDRGFLYRRLQAIGIDDIVFDLWMVSLELLSNVVDW